MRIDKHRICALAVLLALVMGASALAEVPFRGKVISGTTLTVCAPFGGQVEEITLRKGDPIHVGDVVATLKTTKVFAEMDGTISAVFAREGDQVEGINNRYGGVMYIEPVHRYTVSATNEKAYNSSDTKYIHIGEKVHLSCTKDGTHVGTAVVTKIEQLNDAGVLPYVLEVTSGDFYMGETVGIYRDPGYSADSRIGQGTIHQCTAVAVGGSGSVLKLHVHEGDQVERGELLFETVEGVLDGLYATDNIIYSPLDGIVASVEATQGSSVEKDGKLVSVFPMDGLQIEISVSEYQLNDIHEGDKVSISFDWDLDGDKQMEGTVSRISRVEAGEATDKVGDAEYSAYVDFVADDTVRTGMTVYVYTQDPGASEPGEALEDEPEDHADPVDPEE